MQQNKVECRLGGTIELTFKALGKTRLRATRPYEGVGLKSETLFILFLSYHIQFIKS